MLGARIHLQLGQLPPSEAVAREHPLDRLADHLGRTALELVAKWAAAEAAGIARVAVIQLVVELGAPHGDLFGVHDDDEVAGVDVRRVLRLALAPPRGPDLGRPAAKRPALRVNPGPPALRNARPFAP